MKTPEDEAFDELAKKQGAWGGGFHAKRAAAADKTQEPVLDLDGHVVGKARKPKGQQMPRDAEIARLNEKVEFLARTNMLYRDWEHRETQVTSELIRKGIEEAKINAELRAEIEQLKAQLAQTAQESWREFASDYERGFIDGMQKQAQSSVDKAVNRMAQPAQEPAAQEKIHALKPMLEALRIKQVVSFSESQKLLAEVANKSGMLPPAFEISGNQWCALVNLAVTRFGNTTPPKREWVGLTDGEVTEGLCRTRYALQTAVAWVDGVEWAAKQLKEKNT